MLTAAEILFDELLADIPVAVLVLVLQVHYLVPVVYLFVLTLAPLEVAADPTESEWYLGYPDLQIYNGHLLPLVYFHYLSDAHCYYCFCSVDVARTPLEMIQYRFQLADWFSTVQIILESL